MISTALTALDRLKYRTIRFFYLAKGVQPHDVSLKFKLVLVSLLHEQRGAKRRRTKWGGAERSG